MPSIKGSITADIHRIFEKMKDAGVGKDKSGFKRSSLSNGKEFFDEYKGKIFSFSTLETYKPIAKNFAHWCVDKFNIEKVYEITPRMMKAYVQENSHLSTNTLKTRLAAIAKLGEGLGKAESFHRISTKVQQTLPTAKASRPVYSDSQIKAIAGKLQRSSPQYVLPFQVQVETDCRVKELAALRKEDLLGTSTINSQLVGKVRLSGKGGLIREVSLSYQTYKEMEKSFQEKVSFTSYGGYRCAVQRAAKSLGLEHGGTHAVRRYGAQKLYKEGYHELRQRGLTTKEAAQNMLHEVNRQLGHSPNRKSTTRVYINAR